MNWKHHVPLLTATALIIATQVICTYALVNALRHDSMNNLQQTLHACDKGWTVERVGVR
jgi:hypothetical protein